MFQSLVIALREGLEAALIVGIVLGYLLKTGRGGWSRVVWWGVGVAVIASCGAAYLIHRLAIVEEAYGGWLMVAGALFVASMVYWMWKTGKRLRQEIEGKLSSVSDSPTHLGAWSLFLFVFLMVLREGIETVLSLTAVSLRTSELTSFMGSLLGLALAVGLGVAFFKGSLKANLRKFFSVTSLVLLVVAFQLLVSGVHELSEVRILPSSPREMALVGPLVNNDAFFFVVIVALVLFLVAAERIRAGGPQEEEMARLSPPERRKARAEGQRDRFWKMVASAVSVVVVVLISLQFIYSRTAQAVSPPERLALLDGEVRIPVRLLQDRKLHRFVVSVGARDVRLIAILDDSDSVRAALDACQICGSQGYSQDGHNVVCRNCAAAIHVPSIGRAGGCNPVPIDYRVTGETLTFPQDALVAAARLFER